MADVNLPLEVIERLPALRSVDADEEVLFRPQPALRYPTDQELRTRQRALKALATRRRQVAEAKRNRKRPDGPTFGTDAHQVWRTHHAAQSSSSMKGAGT